jgi:hypothetical protein
MKANLRPDPEDGPERAALRAFLRHWHVAGPPPDIEEELRRTFRRRRSRRRPVAWLALAAGLALLALWQVTPTGRPVPPERPVVVATPRPAPSVPPEPSPVAVGRAEAAAAPASPARLRRVPVPPATESEVIVESGQAGLLVQLGRELQTLRQAEPGGTPPPIETVPADAPEAPIPKMHAAEAPSYRAEWETVAGEWPFIHRFVPGSGR